MSTGRVVLIVLGTLVGLLGLALAAGGGFLLWTDLTQREDGYLTTPTERFAASSYALTREKLEVDTGGSSWAWNEDWLGSVRIRAESATGKPVFIGIAREPEVARYLGRVARSDVEDIDIDPFLVRHRQTAAAAPPEPPTDQVFWAASAWAEGRQTLTSEVRNGDWSAVLINAD